MENNEYHYNGYYGHDPRLWPDGTYSYNFYCAQRNENYRSYYVPGAWFVIIKKNNIYTRLGSEEDWNGEFLPEEGYHFGFKKLEIGENNDQK